MSESTVMTTSDRQQAVTTSQNDNGAGSMMALIERVSMSPDADIDKLERLMAMKERWDNQQAVQAFNTALAQMQCEIPSIAERGKAHNTAYALFEDINEVVKPIMRRFGFAITFKVKSANGGLEVTGILMHTAGHREETTMLLPLDTSGSKNNVQAVGSSTSYGKRYVMSALLNITTRGSDDDGEAAAPVKRVSTLQARSIDDTLGMCSEATNDWFVSKYGESSSVPRGDFDGLMASLNKRANAGGGE